MFILSNFNIVLKYFEIKSGGKKKRNSTEKLKNITTKFTMWHKVEMKTIFPWGGGALIFLNLAIFFVCVDMLMVLCL